MSIVKEFFWTKKEKEFFHKWLKNYEKDGKPLFIRGIDGNGKTTLAKEILKDYSIIHINIDFIYGKGDIIEYIENSINKKDIFFMFDKKKVVKALLIDDLQLYMKTNKGFLKKLLDLIKKKQYPKIPIIILCNLETNKGILSIKEKCVHYEHSYSVLQYIKIIKEKDLNKSSELISDYKYKKYIEDCKYNLNTIFINLSTLKNDADSKKELEVLTLDILKNDYSINDLIRFTSSEYITIGYNVLEMCPQILNEKEMINTLLEIYKSQIISDIKEFFYNQRKNDMYYDSVIFSNIVKPIHIIRKNSLSTKMKYSYNSYLSKSLIYIHSQKMYLIHNLNNKDINDKDFLIQMIKEFLDTPNLQLLEWIQDLLYKNSFDKKYIEKRIKFLNGIKKEYDSKKIHNLISKYNMNYNK